MQDIKICFIGLGQRGATLLDAVVLAQKENVTVVCDLYEDRANEAADLVEKTGQPRPAVYTDYKAAIADTGANTVVIATAWEYHVDIAVAAMESGKPVALEVGGAYSIDDCYKLVDTYEKTLTPFMFLENCCFGRRELMVLNMVQQGVFGEVVHCEGGYQHDLREEVANGRENRHYRLRNYLTRNCENYPTHELGPIAKILNINHGNRLLSLTSTASKSAGLHDYILKNKSDDESLKNAKFAQGDVVVTVIKCTNGETITITLDTTLPRYYSRGFTIHGTNAFYEEVTDSIFIDVPEDKEFDYTWRKNCINNAEKYEEKYEHPIWKKFIEDGIQGSHDGIDWLEFEAFFNALRNNEPMPIDVYDAATWMSITVLSEQSVSMGGAPVAIPDFTRGKWALNKLDDLK